MFAALCHLFERNARLPCDDLRDGRLTEPALTSAHPRTGAALDRVDIARGRVLSDGTNDLPFRDLFAAANDLAVGRILGDERVLFLHGKLFEEIIGGAPARKIFVPDQ